MNGFGANGGNGFDGFNGGNGGFDNFGHDGGFPGAPVAILGVNDQGQGHAGKGPYHLNWSYFKIYSEFEAM